MAHKGELCQKSGSDGGLWLKKGTIRRGGSVPGAELISSYFLGYTASSADEGIIHPLG